MIWKGGASLRGITTVSVVESLLLLKAFSSSRTLHIDVYTSILLVFGVNYALLFLYTALIYPEFISPLRSIPRGKWWLPRRLYHQLVRRATAAEAAFQVAQETPNDGLVALREPTGTRLLVTKPQVIGELLVQREKDFAKPKGFRKILHILSSNGLIYLEGDKHKFLRKKSLPHFNFRSVKDLYPSIWNQAMWLVARLEASLAQQNVDSKREEGSVELTHWAARTTENVIGTTVFGRDFGVRNDPKFDSATKMLNTFMEPSAEILLFLLLCMSFPIQYLRMILWRTARVFEGNAVGLKNVCIQLVQERREAIGKGGKDLDIVSNMIKSNDFPDDEIAGQLITYMMAGNDTTSATMCWACYLLAADQTRQSTLRRELSESLGPSFNPKDISDTDLAGTLERLPFLNGVISEALRLYPAVPVTYRTATAETTLAGHSVPAGTEVIVSAWLMNRSPESWGPAADKFQPERWIANDDSSSTRQKIDPTGGTNSNYDFMTFLHGPRGCIGQGFARAELRCLLTAMALHYEWGLDMDDSDVLVEGAITIKPKNGLHLRIKPMMKHNEQVL